MKSEVSSLNSELSEIRYKIRAISHHLGEQSDMLTNLRDHINYCLEHEPDESRISACTELVDTTTALTQDINKQTRELNELWARYNKLMEKKRMSVAK